MWPLVQMQLKMRSYPLYFILFCLLLGLFLTGSAFGQDLGSSNKLFGGAKTPSAAKTAKKTAVRRKPAAAKAVRSRKKESSSQTRTAKGVRKTSQDTGVAKSKFTEFHSIKNTTVEITTPRSREFGTRDGAAADILFEKLIVDGNNARDDRNYSGAESAYQRAVAVKPKDPRAVYGLGNLYSDQQRWDDAEKAYRAAIQMDASDPIAHIALSYVLSQPVTAANLSERYEEAEKLARRALQLGPANPLAFDQLGVTLELRGLIGDETERAYRKSIELNPAFAPAYAHLGRLLRRRGLTRESAAAYQNAIQRATDVGTMILVAEVMQSEQRFAESEQLLRMALDKDPRNPSALLLLGRALTTQGNFADAEKMLRRSVDVSPNGFMPNSLLGELYTRQGKFEFAENALLQAIRFVPVSEKRRLSKQFEAVGDGYLKIGKRTNAERAFRQAIVLDAENAALSVKLAKAHGG